MVALRNTADVQMFLFGKQTKQRLFFSGQRDCQNKSWGPFGPLASPDEVTICSIPLGLRVVLNLVSNALCFMCVCVCRLPVIVLECRCGALWMMNWRKSWEHSPIPANLHLWFISCPSLGRSWLPRALQGPRWRPQWDRNEMKREQNMKKTDFFFLWLLFAWCVPDVTQSPYKVTWVTSTSHVTVWCKATAWSRWRTLPVADRCDSRGEGNKQFELWNRRGSKCQRVVNKARSLHAGKCVRTPHCTHSYGTVWQLCKHQGNAEQNTAWPGTPPTPTPITHHHLCGSVSELEAKYVLKFWVSAFGFDICNFFNSFLLSASNHRWVIKYSYFYC